MKFTDQLLDAIGDVGVDLVDMAERMRFPKSFLRRTLPVAACMAILLGAGLYARSYLSSGSGAFQTATEATAETTTAEAETPREEAVIPDEALVEEVPMDSWEAEEDALETVPYYALELPGEDREMVAVDASGNVLARAEYVEFITDKTTGEYLAILTTTVCGVDSDWKSAERIVYDLQGQEICSINAREILCVGDLVAVNYHPGNVVLYQRDGSLIQDDLQWAIAQTDCICVCPNGAEGVCLYFSPNGALLLAGGTDNGIQRLGTSGTEAETLLVKWENGQAGLINLQGEWVTEPLFDRIGTPFHGYVQCRDLAGDWFLVELESGEIVYKIGEEASVEAYTNCLRWLKDGVMWVEDWYGNVLIPEAAYIQVVDDDEDGMPELFLVTELGGDYVFCGPDGTERLRIADAESVQVVLPQTAVCTKTAQENAAGERAVDFALIDLETGAEIRNFGKPYHGAESVCLLPGDQDEAWKLFYVYYEDAEGTARTDLMDADGNVVLENLQISSITGQSYIGGGVFLTEDGYRYADGSWLYRFE